LGQSAPRLDLVDDLLFALGARSALFKCAELRRVASN
jgi:hypothetical protein